MHILHLQICCASFLIVVASSPSAKESKTKDVLFYLIAAAALLKLIENKIKKVIRKITNKLSCNSITVSVLIYFIFVAHRVHARACARDREGERQKGM